MKLRDFIGGSPIAVAIRLAILSIIVGLVLSFFGITPYNLYYILNDLARRIYDMGFDAFRWAGDYLILGAMVVIPIWLLVRLLRSGSNDSNG